MSDQTSSQAVVEASGSAAERMLATAMKELRDSTLTAQGEAADKFFPNGIELIQLTVSVGNVSIEFKVAGEKGLKCEEGKVFELDLAEATEINN